MPNTFVILALAMCVLAAMFVVVPAQRSARESGQSWMLAAGIFAAVIVAGSAAFYSQTSTWNWSTYGLPESPVAQQLYELQRAVHSNENDATAWASLGRFYLRFEQLPPAIDALEKSIRLSQGRDVETNLSLVEALALRGAPNDRAQSAEVLNETLKQDPSHRKALWYGGEVAASLGQWDVAIARWQVMLNASQQVNSEEAQSVTRLLEQRIAAARQERDNTGSAHVDGSQSSPEAVRIRVSLTNEMAQTPALTPSTNVFVFVRAKEPGGPPLAVHRSTVGQLPLDIVLSDDDAMMPGRTLSAFDDLEIVARVSLGGTPTMTPGDLFGLEAVGVGDERDVEIAISQVAAQP